MNDIAEQPFVLTDVGLCYFAALIHGLRLINEKALERPTGEHFNADALIHYVRYKGDRLVYLMEQDKGRPETVGRIEGPKPERKIVKITQQMLDALAADEAKRRPIVDIVETPILEPALPHIEAVLLDDTEVSLPPIEPKRDLSSPKQNLGWENDYDTFAKKRVDVLLTIERQLSLEIDHVAREGYGRKFKSAIAEFRAAMGIRKTFKCNWCGWHKLQNARCDNCGSEQAVVPKVRRKGADIGRRSKFHPCIHVVACPLCKSPIDEPCVATTYFSKKRKLYIAVHVTRIVEAEKLSIAGGRECGTRPVAKLG